MRDYITLLYLGAAASFVIGVVAAAFGFGTGRFNTIELGLLLFTLAVVLPRIPAA